MIIIDIAEEQTTPDWIIEPEFLQQCRSLLTQQGHIAFNLLVKDGTVLMHFLIAIHRVFDGLINCLTVADHRNIVVLAYNNLPDISAEKVPSRIEGLEVKWELELEFMKFYQ